MVNNLLNIWFKKKRKWSNIVIGSDEKVYIDGVEKGIIYPFSSLENLGKDLEIICKKSSNWLTILFLLSLLLLLSCFLILL